jgi:hypothetical protein
MSQQPTLDEIQKQHQELLGKISEIDDVDLDISRVQEFLKTLAQAGTYTENNEQRSLLRDFIRYWSSIINDKTGDFPIVQLQPFDLSLAGRGSHLNFLRRPSSLVVVFALIIIIIPVVFFSFRAFTSHPSPTPTPSLPPSAFHCPTSQQVSIWMHVVVSKVTDHESCAFTAGNNGKQLSGTVCTSQDGGTTIEFIPVNQRNTVVVRACDGSQLPNIWGLTIRFISGYPLGDASVCAITRSARNNVQAGWKVQADC